ncbi:major facilitator superfamily domain-containing protein [Naematelia encephala]|uniref:Major facilitator superfamily domain-containing protein n=1 Tax=Naematelia encephala TaxID=71784 RepID=A0A1Y2ANG3_9TREE|nr:major facilitator superfamily domain-containing protein [Naematelia encephala]
MGDDDDDDEMEIEEGRRGLEQTLETLGFGAYHWRLLALCGFGWMSDNSALQCIAVILPRVQVHFDLSSKVVGLLSASTMAGMMIGAVGWGVVSDLLGRALPFNSTLFLTAVFGIGASFAPSFGVLCIWMFLLGSAVGGSMPTDGTLFLENLPHSKQYLLTLLSVFFSLGAVLSSVVSLVFLPGASCQQYEGCNLEEKANDGWRRVLLVLGLFNLVCSFARWGLFRLHESPRYLVSNGRQDEAVVVLRAIATFNEHDINIQCADVHMPDEMPGGDVTEEASIGRDKKNSELPSPQLLGIERSRSGERSPLPRYSITGDDSNPGSGTLYDSVGMGPPPLPRQHPVRLGSAFYQPTPADGDNSFDTSFGNATNRTSIEEADEEHGLMNGRAVKREASPVRHKNAEGGLGHVGLGWIESWGEQMAKLFTPQWRRTVILMWIIWGSMSFSYTMFNVWLPSVLESRAEGEGDEKIREALKEFVLYSLAGCPGSIVSCPHFGLKTNVGAWMIQTRLGRRKSLAICTLATAISTFAFIKVQANWAVIVSSMTISAAATAMYAVLYGMTPETFGTSIRGTACGTSAALSRFTGIIAPVFAGFLLTISPSLPVFASAGVFVGTAACSLALPFERVVEGTSSARGGAGFAH